MKKVQESRVYSLGVYQRLYMLQILPATGDYVTLSTVQGIVDKVVLTNEEQAEFKLQRTPEGFKIDPTCEELRFEYQFLPEEEALIKKSFGDVDKAKNLSLGIIPLYEMFMGKKIKEEKVEEENIDEEIEEKMKEITAGLKGNK